MMISPSTGSTSLVSSIYHNKNSKSYKVYNEHDYGAIKAINIAASNAFAEKDAMMVVIINTNITVFAMLHVSSHFNVTLIAEVKID